MPGLPEGVPGLPEGLPGIPEGVPGKEGPPRGSCPAPAALTTADAWVRLNPCRPRAERTLLRVPGRMGAAAQVCSHDVSSRVPKNNPEDEET